MTLSTRRRTIIAVTVVLALLIPLFGRAIAYDAGWKAQEIALLTMLSHAPRFFATLSSIAAVVFGTPATIVFIIAIVALVYAASKSWKRTSLYAAMLAVPLLYVIGIKNIVMRPRPAFAEMVGIAPHSFSFPSGHTASATVLAAVLIYATRKNHFKWLIRVVATLLALSVGASRLLLGVHFPTDVATSLIICPLIVATVVFIFERFVLSTPPHAQ
jgi:undecaprenyl-diphosphatase